MVHAELVKAISEKLDMPQTKVNEVLSTLTDVIVKALKKEGEVKLKDLGKLSVRECAARMGFNPKTKEKIKIAATKKVKFTASKELKTSIL